MSWENNIGFTPENEKKVALMSAAEQEKLALTRRRERLRNLGIPEEYLNSNIEGLKAIIESSKEGPLAKLPLNIEGQLVKSMGFKKGHHFKNAWEKLKENTIKEREEQRLKREKNERLQQEVRNAFEAERIALREEIAAEQAVRNARQAIINRERAQRNLYRNIHRRLQPDYIKAAKEVNREIQRNKSRKARGKNSYMFGTLFRNKKKSINNTKKVNKRFKTKERNSRRKKPQTETEN